MNVCSAEITGSSAEWEHCGCAVLHVEVGIKDLLVLGLSHHVYVDYTIVLV